MVYIQIQQFLSSQSVTLLNETCTLGHANVVHSPPNSLQGAFRSFTEKTNALDFYTDPKTLENRLHTNIAAFKISATFSAQSLRRCRFAAIIFMHTQATKRWARFSRFKNWDAWVGSYLKRTNSMNSNFSSKISHILIFSTLTLSFVVFLAQIFIFIDEGHRWIHHQ